MTEGGSWVLTILGDQQEPGHQRRNTVRTWHQDSPSTRSSSDLGDTAGGNVTWGGNTGAPWLFPIKVLNVKTLGPTCTKNIPEVPGGLL